MCRHDEKRLPCEVDSVRAGRRFVADTLTAWGLTDDDPARAILDDVVLAASELLANAARFCTTPIRLAVDVHRYSVELAVTDNHPDRAIAHSPDHEASSGRGLHIVARISEEWGQRILDSTTKEVWCRIAVPAGSALGHGCFQ
jgi:anti-sigma regulatory factor (Ser/Thr protein kinase)